MSLVSQVDIGSQVITFDEFKSKPPKRFDILDKALHRQISNNIIKCDELEFMPTYCAERDIKSKYTITLYGTLKDGRKARVQINGIRPFFEIRIKCNESEEDAFKNAIIETIGYSAIKTEVIEAKPFRYYQKNNSKFLRIYFKTAYERRAAIKITRSARYETTHDDESSYYRVVCRDHLISFCTWTKLTNYTHQPVDRYQNIKVETFSLSIENYKQHDMDTVKDKTLSCCWDIETYNPTGALPLPHMEECRMFCLTATFQWIHEDNPAFAICFTEFPSNGHPDYLTVVCKKETNIIEGYGIILSTMQPEFIVGFNDSSYDWNWLVKRADMRDMIVDLANMINCGSNRFTNSEDVLNEFNYKKESIKIEATKSASSQTLTLEGYLNIDIMIMYMKSHPREDMPKLNYVLSVYGLNSKEYMPISELFRIYTDYKNFIRTNKYINYEIKTNNANHAEYELFKEQNKNINYYCYIDSFRCHEIMKLTKIIMDNRGLSKLAYVSLFDSLYRANGMKVRNLTIATGQQHPFNIRFSNICNYNVSSEKFQGAQVFHPVKKFITSKLSIEERIKKENTTGENLLWSQVSNEEINKYYDIIRRHGHVHTDDSIKTIERKEGKLSTHFKEFLKEPTYTPVSGLDFSSLYPSICRAYNFSPEYCLPSPPESLKPLPPVSNDPEDIANYTKRLAEYNKIPAYEYLKSIGYSSANEMRNAHKTKLAEVTFEYEGKTRTSFFVRHEGHIDIKSPDFRFGVYPYILNNLFEERALIKKELHAFNKQIETLNKEVTEARIRIGRNITEEMSEYKLINEINEIQFKSDYINSKQGALKVFMNTFYGEAGNNKSPFYVLEVAGGITLWGRINIVLASDFITERKCYRWYGDTDSIYLSLPSDLYDECGRLYYSGKISKRDYWENLINITFVNIEVIKREINKMFEETSRTKFLTMAYEEVLFPLTFLAKKKYFGIPHVSVPNIQNSHVFIRGLDHTKRSASPFLIKICKDILSNCMDINSTDNLLEIINKKILQIYNTKWELSDFVKSDNYKPDKKNVKVLTFAARMKELGIILKPNQRFEYVMVKRDKYKYDMRGCQIPLSVGDRMELVSEVKKNNYEVDIFHYMEKGGVVNQLSRLITHNEMFHVEPTGLSEDEIKAADDKSMKLAELYISNFTKRFNPEFQSFGKPLKKIFRESTKIMKQNFTDDKLANIFCTKCDLNNFAPWLNKQAEKESKKLVSKDYGEKIIKRTIKFGAPKDKKLQLAHYRELVQKLQSYYFAKTGGFPDDTKENVTKKIREEFSAINQLKTDIDAVYSLFNEKMLSIVNHTKSFIDFKTLDPESDIAIDESFIKTKYDEFTNTETYKKIIQSVRYHYQKMIYINRRVYQDESIKKYLLSIKDRSVGFIRAPDNDELYDMKSKGVADCMTNSQEIDF